MLYLYCPFYESWAPGPFSIRSPEIYHLIPSPPYSLSLYTSITLSLSLHPSLFHFVSRSPSFYHTLSFSSVSAYFSLSLSLFTFNSLSKGPLQSNYPFFLLFIIRIKWHLHIIFSSSHLTPCSPLHCSYLQIYYISVSSLYII